jgi:glycosyltransferase involved in cell wall biosynthesis
VSRPRLGLVIQRYGAEVTGGSESLARGVAERLASHYDISVLTTCAVDYVTWANALPAGVTRLGGVEVQRFPVEGQRDLDAFNAWAEPLYGTATTREQELEFLSRQGPVTPGLVDALRAQESSMAAVLFFTYLYWPTWHGVRAAPGRAVLVPTTHDEPPLRFSVFDELFAAVGGFVFLTPPERALVERRFGVGARPQAVAGIGVEPSAEVDVEGFRRRHGVGGPYLLYAGRIDAGKGCVEMLDFYARWAAGRPGVPALLLIGSQPVPLPPVAGVRYLGFLPEAEKRAALAGARAVLCPSPYESLSIVLLEALAYRTPVLVNGRSPVLQDHCVRSGGGLWYEDGQEFAAALDRLLGEEALRAALGASGQRYVRAEYAWDTVLGRFRSVIDAVASAPPARA